MTKTKTHYKPIVEKKFTNVATAILHLFGWPTSECPNHLLSCHKTTKNRITRRLFLRKKRFFTSNYFNHMLTANLKIIVMNLSCFVAGSIFRLCLGFNTPISYMAWNCKTSILYERSWMASFCLSQCDGLKWMDRVVFGAASSNARASEKCPPCNEKRPRATKNVPRATTIIGGLRSFVPVSQPSATSPLAPSRPWLGTETFGLWHLGARSLMVLSTPIMRIIAPAKFVSARRSAFLNVPSQRTNYGSGGARPVRIAAQDTEKPRLAGSDEKGCPGSVKIVRVNNCAPWTFLHLLSAQGAIIWRPNAPVLDHGTTHKCLRWAECHLRPLCRSRP